MNGKQEQKHPNFFFFFNGNSVSWLYCLYSLGPSNSQPPSSTGLVWLGWSMQLILIAFFLSYGKKHSI